VKEARRGSKERRGFSAEEERICAHQEMVHGEDRATHRRKKMKATQQRPFQEQKRKRAEMFPHAQKTRAENSAAQTLSHEGVRSHIAPDPIDCCMTHRDMLMIQSSRINHIRKFKMASVKCRTPQPFRPLYKSRISEIEMECIPNLESLQTIVLEATRCFTEIQINPLTSDFPQTEPQPKARGTRHQTSYSTSNNRQQPDKHVISFQCVIPSI
jgi:hypothetical protein